MTARQDAAIASGLAAAPRGVAGLPGALKRRLLVVAAGFAALETKTEGEQRAPLVLDGWLPPKKDSEAENYPFLIVRPRAGIDTVQGADENATAQMEIIVGTYSDTDDGSTDLLLLIDAIRSDLAAQPVLEATAYEHIGPLNWTIPEQQARPQWIGTITTNWQLPRPLRRDAAEG